MSISPLSAYLAHCEMASFENDAAQQQGLAALNSLHQSLLLRNKVRPFTKGVYLWGDVGRGKTFLMDLFYDSLPKGQALRLHFHAFMARLHQQLNTFAGHADPLKKVAHTFAKECQVLCFDEFFINDIGDAMLLGGVMEALFDEGVVLVATSNIPVHLLFQNQLQKKRFVPVISLLQSRLIEIHLDGQKDHRLTQPITAATYYLQESQLELRFNQLVAEHASNSALFNSESFNDETPHNNLIINGRSIPVRKIDNTIAWFDFSALCEGARSSLDYMQLAQDFDHILVSNIPELSNSPFEQIKARGTEDSAIGSGVTGNRKISLGIHDNAVRRFISLVDEAYDNDVTLYLSASVPLEQLYKNGALLFEFRRTFSRLIEMQTINYQEKAQQRKKQ